MGQACGHHLTLHRRKGHYVSSAEEWAAAPQSSYESSYGSDPNARCAQRRTIALENLANQYYGRLVRFLKRRGHCGEEDAADLAQDTFARLSATDLAAIREPASFLFTTALNLIRDRARSSQSRHAAMVVPAEETQLVCPAPHPERVLDGEQRMRAVEVALGELSPKCRAVFVLFHFDGLSQREIADRLRISVSMVEKYVKQAVSHCQSRLAELNGEAPDNGGCAP
jgi:RNA polymerase sigma factor (sigma-70 family)